MVEFHFFACSCPDVPTPLAEEAVFTSFYASASFVEYQLTIETWVYFWALYSVPLIYVFILIPLPDCFDYCDLVIQKLKVCLYTNNETLETEIRGKNPIWYSNKKIKYLGINLTKEVKDLYSENYTTLKKEIKEDTNKWKHVPFHGLEELTSSECPHYLKQSIDTMQSSLKYQWHISQM